MSAMTMTRAEGGAAHGTEPLDRCTGHGTLTRPLFAAGLLLQDDDLTSGVDHARHLSRLLFRNLFGCGVVCGLRVTAQETRNGCLVVTVAPGLALDCAGGPIEVPDRCTMTLKPDCDEPVPDELWVVLRRKELCCRKRDLACPPEEGSGRAADPVPTRLRDGYEIEIRRDRPVGACGRTPDKGHEDNEHENGVCACDCCMTPGWVVLAKFSRPTREDADKLGMAKPEDADRTGTARPPRVISHQVRRFVRPVLLADPLSEVTMVEQKAATPARDTPQQG